MKTTLALLSALLLSPLTALHAAEIPASPMHVWADYDPNKGDFKEEIVKAETKDGNYYRESYISAYVAGAEIRIFCQYKVRAGVQNAPGLLNVHGWMGAPSIDPEYVNDGWAEMTYDYCGDTHGRPHFTKYPDALKHCNMDAKFGGTITTETRDHQSIADPKQTSLYVWYAMSRRVLSYLEQQKEVDRTRLGARG